MQKYHKKRNIRKEIKLPLTSNDTIDYQTTLPVSWETCMQDKKQQLEPDMEQWTGSKLGKEYVKAVYCHSALTCLHTTSCKMLNWITHKLESRLPVEMSTTSNMQ